ncbi:MAG TPA: hypothetical protein VFG38_21580 [Pseudomonadales bacterium]|nr:hypothetical protein [Pseudomonadales bacterium]
MKSLFVPAVALLASSTLIACQSIGPSHVVQDRFSYADAISRSWKENILLNLVKLRYADAPLFLDVASVVEQYSLQGEVSGLGQFPAKNGANPSSVGGSVQWADRPTITYQPLTGQHFTKSLLTPLGPELILDLVQAGWPLEAVFRFGVRSINGIRGAVVTRAKAEPEDPRFPQLIAALQTLQQRGDIGVRREKKGADEETFLVIAPVDNEQLNDERRIVTDLLGVDPALTEYRLGFGAVSKGKDEIVLLTRTVLDVLVELSFDVQVPAEHEADGRVGPPLPRDIHVLSSLHVSSGEDRPSDAFASVRYEDRWFWIDARDFASKRTLSFIMILLALSETGPPAATPSLTLPAG